MSAEKEVKPLIYESQLKFHYIEKYDPLFPSEALAVLCKVNVYETAKEIYRTVGKHCCILLLGIFLLRPLPNFFIAKLDEKTERKQTEKALPFRFVFLCIQWLSCFL